MANIYSITGTDNHSTGDMVVPEKPFEEIQTEMLTDGYNAAKYMLMSEKEVMTSAVMGAVDVLAAAELNPDRFCMTGFPPYGFSLDSFQIPRTIELYDGHDIYLTIFLASTEQEDEEGHPLIEISYGLRRETSKGTMLYDFDNYSWTEA